MVAFLVSVVKTYAPNGEIKYVEGKVRCNLHFENEIDEDEDGGDSGGTVSYL